MPIEAPRKPGTMREMSLSRAAFAATMIVVGIVGFIRGDFAPVWEPAPNGMPAREFLVYVSALLSLATGACLLSTRRSAPAARVLLVALMIWFLTVRVPVILRAPLTEVSWEGSGETAVILAGAWVLHAWFTADTDLLHVRFATGGRGVPIGRIFFGLWLIPLGLAHLVYLKMTAGLVPGWLPAPSVWAFATGVAYIAAGIAVITGVCARLAATLSAIQMGVFTLLVWVPALVTGHRDASTWSETILSCVLTASAWIVADSYRGSPAPHHVVTPPDVAAPEK
jgi:uncharacterized membrane protein